MKRFVAILLLLAALAGCTSDDDPDQAASAGYRLDCAISNWAETCSALASPNESPSKTEIDLAVNPTNPLNVFVASKDLDPLASNCVWSVGQVTMDGGATWNTTYVGGTAAERAEPSHPLFGWDCVTDPIMTFDADGRLYYGLQAYNLVSDGPQPPVIYADGSAFFLAISDDGGQTFPADRIVPMAAADGNLVFHDYPRMAVSPATGSVSTVWNAIGTIAPVVAPYVATTYDGGASIYTTVAAHPERPTQTAFASGYAADARGIFYMTVETSTVDTPVLAISNDDASTFTTFKPMLGLTQIPGALPNSQFRTFTAVELAADTVGANGGRLYAFWADYAEGNSDILVAFSDNGGDYWSLPIAVSRDRHDQFMVRGTVDERGHLHLVYFDRQYDAGNRLLDVTHAWSTDGGQTWHEQRLTTTSFDGDLGIHQNGGPFIGDYLGIGAAGDHVWMGYPTTQSGRAEIAVSHATWTG